MIMQSAFFKMADIIPLEDAVKYLKDSVIDSYGLKGQKIIDMNNAAIDMGIEAPIKVNVPASWKTATDTSADSAKLECACSSTAKKEVPEFIEKKSLCP